MPLPYDQLAAIRLGFGLSPRLSLPDSPGGVVSSVAMAAPDGEAVTMDMIREMQNELRSLSQQARKGGQEEDRARRQFRQMMGRRYLDSILSRFARALDDPAGFGERLVAFWASHFTVRGGTPHTDLMVAALVDEAIRPHLSGRFADMLFAAETHPAMLIYLDQIRSVGPNSVAARKNRDKMLGVNENLAREMIELHSLGVGAGYTQADIEGLARLLTGLSYDPRRPGVFQPALSEPGAEAILGESFGSHRNRGTLEDVQAVIGELAGHEATAHHLARKMAVHFVADDPPESLVGRLAGVFLDTGGDLGAMNLTLAEAPELATHFRQKLRQPFDFVVAGLRALGVSGQDLRAVDRRRFQQGVLQPMAVMGQPWARPGGPDGWPEEAEAWGTPQGIAMRINWAMRQPAEMLDRLPDPRDFLTTALGDAASEPLRWAVPRAESRAEGVALVLASADFNRR
ncbi:MAG: DUF1800 family protein [Paracoccus sp. (in: a-proteobacteria)]